MKTIYTLLFISISFTDAIGQKTELVYKAKWVKPVYNAQYNKVFTTDSSITASFFANDSFRTKDLKLSIADGFMVTTQYNTKGELLWSNTIAKGRQQQSINVADLGKGIYFVQVASSKQISHSSLAIE